MFAIDIFYFHKFYLFYKVLILLLYPLVMKSILYGVKEYAKERQSEMEKFAIPSFNEVTDEWQFIWREDKAAILTKIILIDLFLIMFIYITHLILLNGFLLYG